MAVGLLFTGVVAAQESATNSASAPGPQTVNSLISDSSQAMASGDFELAIRDATLAIQLDPKNAAGYEMRGSIYIEQKLWDRAERDYIAAQKNSPDVVYQYKLAQIKFLQKSYMDALPSFVALEGDPHLGDLALYEAFLCDLLSDHQEATLRQLALLDLAPKTPAYYFCHAAWCLYHNQRAEAGKYFGAAGGVYDSATTDRYVARLLETERFRVSQATFDAKDGRHFEHASVFLEGAGLRVSAGKSWITLPLDQVPDDLTPFPEEVREQIAHKRAVHPTVERSMSLVSFTSRPGKIYSQVRWSVEQDGLSVLSPDGWTTVPFAQLPEDQSSFPADLQLALAEQRKIAPVTAEPDPFLTFTTRHGKLYDHLRTTMGRNGVSVLTTDGRVLVPFADLPADISAFPADWQTQIRDGAALDAHDTTGPTVITFTTRKGRHYDQVRAAIEKNGLRVMTSDGLIAVPFDQLPEDLSVFPQDWRQTIIEKKNQLLQRKTSSN